MTYLADSNFIIDCLTHQPDARQLLPTLLREGLALSFVSHMELWEGVYGGRDPQGAARQLRQLLRRVTIIPFSHRASLRTAALRQEMRRLGLPLNHRLLDILIAGAALAHDRTVVTSDQDFADIPDLRRLNPRTGARS